MATFARRTFNASNYSASRPTYPAQLFEHVFLYHQRGSNLAGRGSYARAVDVGCGTGQASLPLAESKAFEEVLCIDPSPGMLDKARAYLSDKTPQVGLGATGSKFSFAQGSAEDLGGILEDGSADLLIAAQACHWFDWTKVWPETKRVLRPRGGAAAFWVYGEMRFTHFPSLGPRTNAFWKVTDKVSEGDKDHDSIGAYFQRPGRTVLERLLVDVPAPSTVSLEGAGKGDGLVDFQRVYFTDDESDIPPPQSQLRLEDGARTVLPTVMKLEWTWLNVLAYIRTASALHAYHEAHPEDLQRPPDVRFLEEDLADVRARYNVPSSQAEKDKEEEEELVRVVSGGDVATRFWKDLREGAAHDLRERGCGSQAGEEEGKRGVGVDAVDAGVGLYDRVTVEWPVAMLLVRRA